MTIVLSQKAERALLKLEKERKAKIISAFFELMNNPFLGKELAGKYKGYVALRMWPLKIIYEVHQEKGGEDFLYIIDIGGAKGLK